MPKCDFNKVASSRWTAASGIRSTRLKQLYCRNAFCITPIVVKHLPVASSVAPPGDSYL